ncbi:MAG: PEP-CTERM sorting domain-containing protein [Planctomycetes bacterium]|nr:PEP-CTERM sorting domain-containing protein [Planctomycetota bacterium]
MKRTLFIAALGMTLTGAANADAVTTWSYLNSDLRYVDLLSDSDLPVWRAYNPGPTVGSSPLSNGIKLHGGGSLEDKIFALTGADYVPSPVSDPDFRGNLLVIYGTGTIDGAMWTHPDDFIRTSFGFGFDFSGGTLDIYKVETSFILFDSSHNPLIGVGSGTGLGIHEPGGYGYGFAFEDRFGSNYQTATAIEWQVTFGFDWTGMSAEDTFNFYIPQNSIDIQAVPEPVTMSLLTLGGLAMRRRRK